MLWLGLRIRSGLALTPNPTHRWLHMVSHRNVLPHRAVGGRSMCSNPDPHPDITLTLTLTLPHYYHTIQVALSVFVGCLLITSLVSYLYPNPIALMAQPCSHDPNPSPNPNPKTLTLTRTRTQTQNRARTLYSNQMLAVRIYRLRLVPVNQTTLHAHMPPHMMNPHTYPS